MLLSQIQCITSIVQSYIDLTSSLPEKDDTSLDDCGISKQKGDVMSHETSNCTF